jgi:hypothetical protein
VNVTNNSTLSATMTVGLSKDGGVTFPGFVTATAGTLGLFDSGSFAFPLTGGSDTYDLVVVFDENEFTASVALSASLELF